MESICAAYNVTLAQFFTFDGAPVALTPTQRELLDNWNRLNKQQQSAVSALLKLI